MEGVIPYLILVAARFVLWVMDLIIDLLFRTTLTQGNQVQRSKAKEYEHSAQIVSIIWRAKESLFKINRERYFLYQHEQYVHPHEILKHPYVTLMAVEKEHAIFCMTEPHVNIFNTTMYPFVFISQFLAAKKLIILPIESFHRLADELGDPKVTVSMVNMTARCGSTLLTQVMNGVHNVRAMSEPYALNNIVESRCCKQVTVNESTRLLRSGLRLLTKVEPESNIQTIFIKMNPMGSPLFVEISEMFPQVHLIFNTRHPVPSARSLRYVFNYALFQTFYCKCGAFWRDWAAFNFLFPYDSKYEAIFYNYSRWYQNINLEKLSFLYYATVMAAYFDHPDIYKEVIFYEDISEDPASEFGKVFDLMGLSRELLTDALKALQRDSQDGTFGQQGRARKESLEPEFLQLIDECFQELGVPLTHSLTTKQFKDSILMQQN